MFSCCESLTNVTIPEGIISIGSCAFSGCTSLTSIRIPRSVKTIGESCFEGCTNLSEITIPRSRVNMDQSTFKGCQKLEKVTIPNDKQMREAFCKTPYYKKYNQQKEEERLLRIQNQEKRKQAQRLEWKSNNLCQCCGGAFKGLLTKKCSSCGRQKDY